MRCQHFIVLVTLLANNIYYCFESCATQLKRENALIVMVVMSSVWKVPIRMLMHFLESLAHNSLYNEVFIYGLIQYITLSAAATFRNNIFK